MELDEKKVASVFKAFCDENRVKILKMLLTGEKCSCMILKGLSITQPTLSHHTKILCESGIVSLRKDGRWSYYSISPEGSEYAMECLKALTSVQETEEK